MAQDVRQWLDEIKRLQQQLTAIIAERDAALDSAAQWRQLYNTEAQQRRTEAQLHQQAIDALKAEVEKLQNFLPNLPTEAEVAAYQQEVEQLQTVDTLKAKLMDAFVERDRCREEVHHLTQALKEEQARHAETRKSLTTALGDAVDLLAKHQEVRSVSVEVVTHLSQGNEAGFAELPPAKNDWLQLPSLE